MADDISKKITIEVEAETDKLEKNIKSLNTAISGLLEEQKKLSKAGKDSSAAFEGNAQKLDSFQKSLKEATTQLTAYNAALNTATTTLQKEQALVTSLTAAKSKYSSSVAGNSKEVKQLDSLIKALNTGIMQQEAKIKKGQKTIDGHSKSLAAGAIKTTELKEEANSLSSTLQQQQQTVNKSKSSFNAHKLIMDHVKTSFNELKGASGGFGQSLQDSARGFNVMKSGFKLVTDGFKGIGAAIKADGFDFLLQILQYVFDYFFRTSKGSKILSGALSAIGAVISKITGFVHSFLDAIINAFSHPVETLKELGRMIEQNLINRFKAIGTILDGIIHLDFKKMADGALQAVTGVTNATDKMANAFNSVKKGVEDTVNTAVTAFKNGYADSGKHVKKFEKETTDSNNRLKQSYKGTASSIPGASTGTNVASQNTDQPDFSAVGNALSFVLGSGTNDPSGPAAVQSTKDTEDKKTEIKKTALQKFEDYANKNAASMATNDLNMLAKSLQAQSAAKVQALEKDKANELSNKDLTASQKAAIEAKYKKQEDAVKAKAFKQQQEISIAQAIINGATAITKTEADLGPIAGTLAIAQVVAQTALQVSTIAKQKPPAMAKGGYFMSDGKGAILPGYSRTDNTNAHLRSGEAVVVSEAMRDPWARNLVSAINVAYGGRDFSVPNTSRGYAVGGIFTDGGNANRYYNQPVTDQKNLANTVAYQMINNFPPVYVDVKDINTQQNILAQTVNRVNL